MPEREIDEEDTETAELQTTLRRFQRVTSSGSDKEDVQEDRRHRRVGSQEAEETEEDRGAGSQEAEEDRRAGSQEVEEDRRAGCQIAEEDRGQRRAGSQEAEVDRRQRRAGSQPEREILTADTETAQFQSNLRKLAAFSHSAGEVSEQADCEVEKRPSKSNKTVFRPGMRSGPGQALRRSRTWEGFGSGLRYESVSDAGLPPPPPPPPNKR